MKKLITLISTTGKTQQQIIQQTDESFKKFNQVSETATKALEEKQWRELLKMAKNRGKQRAEEVKSTKSKKIID